MGVGVGVGLVVGVFMRMGKELCQNMVHFQKRNATGVAKTHRMPHTLQVSFATEPPIIGLFCGNDL